MSDTLARLRHLEAAATPAPWCWMATGEKDNSWALGVAVWDDESPVVGEVHDQEEERWNEETGEGETATIVEGIAESIGDNGPLSNPALLVAARNALPLLLDIAESARWHYSIHQADTACDVCDAWLAFAALDRQETE